MEKVYVTQGELNALDKSIKTHQKKQEDLDGGECSYVWCHGDDCPCCIHAGLSWKSVADCNKCAIGKSGHKGCSNIGWTVTMGKYYHQKLLDNLIKIRERCVIGEKPEGDVK